MAEAAKPDKDWSYEEVRKGTCRFYYWEQEQIFQGNLGLKLISGEQFGISCKGTREKIRELGRLLEFFSWENRNTDPLGAS